MEPPLLDNIIEEIDYSKVQLLLDSIGVIQSNATKKKEFIFPIQTRLSQLTSSA